MIKAIIMDFDGTIVDSMNLWQHLASTYLKNLNISDDKIDQKVKDMTLKESSIYLKKHFQLEQSIETIRNQITNLIARQYLTQVTLKKDVEKFILECNQKGIQLYIYTTNTTKIVEMTLKRFGLRKYFNQILTCNDFNFNKITIDDYGQLLKILNFDQQEVIFIEDSYLALKTLTSMNYQTVGLQDEEDIQEVCDVYLTSWKKRDRIWKKF